MLAALRTRRKAENESVSTRDWSLFAMTYGMDSGPKHTFATSCQLSVNLYAPTGIYIPPEGRNLGRDEPAGADETQGRRRTEPWTVRSCWRS